MKYEINHIDINPEQRQNRHSGVLEQRLTDSWHQNPGVGRIGRRSDGLSQSSCRVNATGKQIFFITFIPPEIKDEHKLMLPYKNKFVASMWSLHTIWGGSWDSPQPGWQRPHMAGGLWTLHHSAGTDQKDFSSKALFCKRVSFLYTAHDWSYPCYVPWTGLAWYNRDLMTFAYEQASQLTAHKARSSSYKEDNIF